MPFQTERRVEFRDTDAAGIVHFSAFFPMMEAAEHELLRSIGLSVMPSRQPAATDLATDSVSWPRVAANCDFVGAARFEDLLTIGVRVGHIGNSSVRYDFEIDRGDTPIARGKITAVCCHVGPGSRLEKVPIPDDVRLRLSKMQ